MSDQGSVGHLSRDDELFQSEQVERILHSIRDMGFEAEEYRDFLAVRSQNLVRPASIPLSEVDQLEKQISLGPEPIADYFGFVNPGTYLELIVRSPRIGYIHPRLTRLEVAEVAQHECRHTDANTLPALSDPDRYTPNNIRTENNNLAPVHVFDEQSATCVELSWASPCGLLFGPPGIGPRFRPRLSLKIEFGTALPDPNFTEAAMSIANAFMYELSVRNGVLLEPVAKSTYERTRSSISADRTDIVRFPRTQIGHEVAELFAFAEAARDNLPLAYLSFYQVLEYFFPFAVRRHTLTSVRKELLDPSFQSTESDLLRIIEIAEAGAQAPEREQISTLIAEAVRESKLIGFFSELEDSKHFSKSGPISGVETINTKNPQMALARQVSSRVYGIRNRIVHAKDDPKFADVRVLLPRSREAAALRPDVDLIRLLAVEVITDSQLRTQGSR